MVRFELYAAAESPHGGARRPSNRDLIFVVTTREKIDDFLTKKRLALVGVSRSPRHFTRVLWREFVKRGYDVVPVNPNMPELEGRKCYASVAEIAPPVEGALIMTAADAAQQVALDCARAGIRRVWMYRAVGKGAVNPTAVDYCEREGIAVSTGCPFMFLPGAGFPHNLHAWFLKITGSYPK